MLYVLFTQQRLWAPLPTGDLGALRVDDRLGPGIALRVARTAARRRASCLQKLLAHFVIMSALNERHHATLEAIFSKPTLSTLEWSRIEALLVAAGCVVNEGPGSRLRLAHGTQVAGLHRPHPTKEAKSCQVEDARASLALIGVKP